MMLGVRDFPVQAGFSPSRPAYACVLEYFFNFAEGSMKQKAPKPSTTFLWSEILCGSFQVTSGSGSESA